MKRKFLASVALLFLAACTPNTYDRGALITDLRAAGPLDEKDILIDLPVDYAVPKRGERCSPMAVFCIYRGSFWPGILVLQKDKVTIFHNYQNRRSKDVDLKFEEIEGVAVATWGMFQNIHQVQLLTSSKVYAFNVDQPADLQKKLLAAGLKPVEPIGRVVDGANVPIIYGPPS